MTPTAALLMGLFVRRCTTCHDVDHGSAYGAKAREAAAPFTCDHCGGHDAEWVEVHLH